MKSKENLSRDYDQDSVEIITKTIKDREKTGFIPVKARWAIKRTNSWLERCKSFSKNFEITLEHATAKINLCFIRLMLNRLALAEPSDSYIA